MLRSLRIAAACACIAAINTASAQAHGIAFRVTEPKPAKRFLKAYADNFAFGRKQPWTH